MKFLNTKQTEYNLSLDNDFYQRGGVDVMLHVKTKENAVIVTLPSLKDEVKMRLWFKIFLFDIERNSEVNNITIRTSRNEKINGTNEINLKLNGIGVMIQPMSTEDWMCFIPMMAGEGKVKEKSGKKEKEEPATAGGE
jgi:hypothetical protein